MTRGAYIEAAWERYRTDPRTAVVMPQGQVAPDDLGAFSGALLHHQTELPADDLARVQVEWPGYVNRAYRHYQNEVNLNHADARTAFERGVTMALAEMEQEVP